MHRLAARSAAWRQVSLSLLMRVLRLVLMLERDAPCWNRWIARWRSLQGMDAVAGVGSRGVGRTGADVAVPAQARALPVAESGTAHVLGLEHQPHFVLQARTGQQGQPLL